MARYALIESGRVANVILADPGNEPEGAIAAPDDVGPGWSHDGRSFTAPTPEPVDIRVNAYRLLFELLAPIQQLVLDAVFAEAQKMDPARMIASDQTAREGALVVIRNAKARLDALGEEPFNVQSPATAGFLGAARALGVFGPDGTAQEQAAADAHIARIMANEAA